ncbi:MAG: transcriptional regulator NrdR [Verrucomicrobiota bacterium]
MRCPKCASDSDKVVDSRSSKDGGAIRRRRECLNCGHRFTTYETLERRELFVVKNDGTRERFERNKLLQGFNKACEKRPIKREAIEEAVEAVITDLESRFHEEVPSAEIGIATMNALQNLDAVAFVRYASVYRKFQDVGEFINEIKHLQQDPMKRAYHPELFSPR